MAPPPGGDGGGGRGAAEGDAGPAGGVGDLGWVHVTRRPQGDPLAEYQAAA